MAKLPAPLSIAAPTEQHADNAWQTPVWLVDRVHALLGGIELDPCTTDANPCRAERFYTPKDDGILQPWNAGRIYCNPPYGRTIGHWIDKCGVAGASGSKVVALVPARVGSMWFRRAWEMADEILFFNGRLQFCSDPRRKGGSGSSAFPSALFAWNISLESFKDAGLLVRLEPDGGVAA